MFNSTCTVVVLSPGDGIGGVNKGLFSFFRPGTAWETFSLYSPVCDLTSSQKGRSSLGSPTCGRGKRRVELTCKQESVEISGWCYFPSAAEKARSSSIIFVCCLSKFIVVYGRRFLLSFQTLSCRSYQGCREIKSPQNASCGTSLQYFPSIKHTNTVNCQFVSRN